MSEPKYSEDARIHRAREYANQPWRPGMVVCPIPQMFNGGAVYSRLVMLQRQIERMIEGSTKP